MSLNLKKPNVHYLKINGLNIELSAVGLFAVPAGIFAIVGGLTPKNFGDTAYSGSESKTWLQPPSSLNGVNLGLGGFCMPAANGLILNGTICTGTTINGVEISGVANLNYQFNGIMIAGFENVATHGHGLQIALINKCKTGKVVQLGLFNRIGKRVTPLINFSL